MQSEFFFLLSKIYSSLSFVGLILTQTLKGSYIVKSVTEITPGRRTKHPLFFEGSFLNEATEGFITREIWTPENSRPNKNNLHILEKKLV